LPLRTKANGLMICKMVMVWKNGRMEANMPVSSKTVIRNSVYTLGMMAVPTEASGRIVRSKGLVTTRVQTAGYSMENGRSPSKYSELIIMKVRSMKAVIRRIRSLALECLLGLMANV